MGTGRRGRGGNRRIMINYFRLYLTICICLILYILKISKEVKYEVPMYLDLEAPHSYINTCTQFYYTLKSMHKSIIYKYYINCNLKRSLLFLTCYLLIVVANLKQSGFSSFKFTISQV